MASFRTEAPPGYEPPTREEMLDEASQTGVEQFDPDLVADLCTLAEGGRLKPLHELEQEVRQYAEERATAAGQKVDEKALESELHYQRGMRSFADEVNLSRFPGDSSLQRAMAMLKLLSMMKDNQSVEGENDANGVAKKLNEAMKVANSLTPQERKLLYDNKPPESKTPEPTSPQASPPRPLQPPPKPQPKPSDPDEANQDEQPKQQSPEPDAGQPGKPKPESSGDGQPPGQQSGQKQPASAKSPPNAGGESAEEKKADQTETGSGEPSQQRHSDQAEPDQGTKSGGARPQDARQDGSGEKGKPGSEAGRQEGGEKGKPGPEAGRQEGGEEGRPDSKPGKPQPGSKPEESQLGSKAGKPEPGSEAGEPQPGSEAGEPQPGSEAGELQPGSEAGKPRPGSEVGEPQPGSEVGEPQPGSEAGKPQPGSEAGDGQKAGEEGKPGSDAGSESGEAGATGSGAEGKEGGKEGKSDSDAGESEGGEAGSTGSGAGGQEGGKDGQPGSEAGDPKGTAGGESASPSKDHVDPEGSENENAGEHLGSDGQTPTEGSGSTGDSEAGQSNRSGNEAAELKSHGNQGGADAEEEGEDDTDVPPPDGGPEVGSTSGRERLDDSFAWMQQRQAMRFQNLQVAQDLMEGTDKRYILEASRILDTSKELYVCKDERMVPDLNGTEIRRRPIKDLSEFHKIAPHDLALRSRNRTLFNYMAITGKLMVTERLKRIRRKQLIFMLTDGSESMKGRKHLKSTGYVMNRLKSVLTGDAEIWLSVFDTRMTDVLHASNEEEAIEMMKKYREGDFTGGGTNIGASVLAAHLYILKLLEAGNMYRPEIWVLTDNDSSIRTISPEDVKGTRVHGLAFESDNDALETFCKATGGTFWGKL
jgi:hypothetical protein